MVAESDSVLPIRPPTQTSVSESTVKESIRSSDQNPGDFKDSPPFAPQEEPEDGVDNHNPAETEDEDEDDHGVRYRLTVKDSRPKKITEKKRRDQQALKEFAAQRKAYTSKDSKKLDQSAADSRAIIQSPREYQTELFERAKEKNLIVVLPTGSGKTLISVMLLQHHVDQEVESRAIGNPKKIAFFLVEKVALCEQQYGVLNNNLRGHSIAMFTGDTRGLTKDKNYWDTQFDENMIVICTAHILLDCLNNAFITMDSINLLVFDEAHHAKKKHVYAEIMRRYYYTTHKSERPRVLGMTASPVDAKTRDVSELAIELEKTLDCEIATLSDKVLMQTMAFQVQVEQTVKYDTLGIPDETKTPLWDSIFKLVSRNGEFKASLNFAKDISSTLGPWCADRYWQLSITEDETERLRDRTRVTFVGVSEQVVARADKAQEAVKHVREVVEDHEFDDINPTSPKLSAKVKCLHEILVHAFTVDDKKRCIIFVEQRHTACLLADLYNHASMAIPGMTAWYMVGFKSIFDNKD